MRSDIEVTREPHFELQNILPKVVFPTKLNTIRKVIYLLESVESRYFIRSDKVCPQKIWTLVLFFYQFETSGFHALYDNVTHLSSIWNAKVQAQMFDFFWLTLKSGHSRRDLLFGCTIARVRKIHQRCTSFYHWLNELNLVWSSWKGRLWQNSLFFHQKHFVHRI